MVIWLRVIGERRRWGAGCEFRETDPLITNSLLRHEVDDEDFVEDGEEFFDEGFVVLVREVGFEATLVFEGDDEAVSEPLCVVLGTHIGTPLVVGNSVDLFGEIAEGFFDAGDLGLAGIILELEANDVAIGAFLFLVVIGGGGTHGSKCDSERNKDGSHGGGEAEGRKSERQ